MIHHRHSGKWSMNEPIADCFDILQGLLMVCVLCCHEMFSVFLVLSALTCKANVPAKPLILK